MSDDSYYRALAVADRFYDELENKNITKYEIAKKLGKHKCLLYSARSQIRCPKVMTLYKYAELIDVSFEYLLTGKNKKPFEKVNISFEPIVNRRNELKYKIRMPNKLDIVICQMRKNVKRDINLQTLFELEKYLKMDAYSLLSKK